MTSDKAYAAEVRLNNLWGHLGPVPAGTGNGQRRTVRTTALQTINSTSQVTVGSNGGNTPLQWVTVTTGQYLLSAEINIIPDFSAGVASFRLHGLTLGNMRAISRFWANTGVGQAAIGVTTAMDTDMSSSTMVAGNTFTFELECFLNVATTGTLSIDARTSVNTDTYSIRDYSWATLESVLQTT